MPAAVSIGDGTYISRQEWLERNPDKAHLADRLPASVPANLGQTIPTADWVKRNPEWLTGIYNREEHTPAQQDKDQWLYVDRGGVATYDNRDLIQIPYGKAFEYHTAGPVPDVMSLRNRERWQEQGDLDERSDRLFDIDENGNHIIRLDEDIEQTNPGPTTRKPSGWRLIADNIGDAAFRGYAGATSSTLGRPERIQEFLFGRFGQPFTAQGKAQTDNALQLGRELQEEVRSGRGGLLGSILGVLPDPILNKVPLAANVAGGAIGDFVGLFPARLAWRINPGDLLQTQIMPRAAEAAGVPDAWHAQGEMGRAGDYLPEKDPILKAHWNAPRWLARDMRESGFALKPAIALAAAAMGIGSGNVGNFSTDGGFRKPGYQAVASSTDDPTKTENLPLALVGPLTGGSNRLLPWDAFHAERPDITREKYDNYRKYLRGETEETPEADFSLLGGMIRGTSENLDGEAELQMVGGRITPTGVATGVGTGLAATALLSNWINTGNPVDFSQARWLQGQRFNTAVENLRRTVTP